MVVTFVVKWYLFLIFFSAVNDLIILILLTVSESFDVFNSFYFFEPAHNALSIIPAKINKGDKAIVTNDILHDAKNAIIIPVKNELKL